MGAQHGGRSGRGKAAQLVLLIIFLFLIFHVGRAEMVLELGCEGWGRGGWWGSSGFLFP